MSSIIDSWERGEVAWDLNAERFVRRTKADDIIEFIEEAVVTTPREIAYNTNIPLKSVMKIVSNLRWKKKLSFLSIDGEMYVKLNRGKRRLGIVYQNYPIQIINDGDQVIVQIANGGKARDKDIVLSRTDLIKKIRTYSDEDWDRFFSKYKGWTDACLSVTLEHLKALI